MFECCKKLKAALLSRLRRKLLLQKIHFTYGNCGHNLFETFVNSQRKICQRIDGFLFQQKIFFPNDDISGFIHLHHPANAPTVAAAQKKVASSCAPGSVPAVQLDATPSVQLFSLTATPPAVQPLRSSLCSAAHNELQERLARSRIVRLHTPAIDRKRMGAAESQSGTVRAKGR